MNKLEIRCHSEELVERINRAIRLSGNAGWMIASIAENVTEEWLTEFMEKLEHERS